MYGKHFASMYTGSMVGAGTHVFAVWGYAISHAQGSRVELNPRLLAKVLGSTEKKMREAIEYLASPDPESRSTENEGRRLVPEGQFQYFLPTSEAYRRIQNEEERREYNRRKQAESRARKRGCVSLTVNDGQSQSSVSAQAEAEADTETETEQQQPRAREEGVAEGDKATDGHGPTASTAGGGCATPVTDKAACPPAMMARLQDQAMRVYRTDYPVSDFLAAFVYPPDSVLSAEDVLEAIRETGLAGVKSAAWTNKRLQAWHASGGRPRASPGGSAPLANQVDDWIKTARKKRDANGAAQ